MSWENYYYLLEKYQGDLTLASREELKSAERGNPNDPIAAYRIARQKYEENKQKQYEQQATN